MCFHLCLVRAPVCLLAHCQGALVSWWVMFVQWFVIINRPLLRNSPGHLLHADIASPIKRRKKVGTCIIKKYAMNKRLTKTCRQISLSALSMCNLLVHCNNHLPHVGPHFPNLPWAHCAAWLQTCLHTVAHTHVILLSSGSGTYSL